MMSILKLNGISAFLTCFWRQMNVKLLGDLSDLLCECLTRCIEMCDGVEEGCGERDKEQTPLCNVHSDTNNAVNNSPSGGLSNGLKE